MEKTYIVPVAVEITLLGDNLDDFPLSLPETLLDALIDELGVSGEVNDMFWDDLQEKVPEPLELTRTQFFRAKLGNGTITRRL